MVPFSGGRNIAMKVPLHLWEATVGFYRDVLGLRTLDNAPVRPPTAAFEFGANRLWIDQVKGLIQPEIWLEVLTPDLEAASRDLEASKVVRRDGFEPLPKEFPGFWIASPASVIHLVSRPDAWSDGDQARETRTAARLVLLDGTGRVLLFRHTDRSGHAHWATPGGGVEPGESIEQAARREAAEEIGQPSPALRALWSGHTEFLSGNRHVVQDETFFLVEGAPYAPGPEVEALHRREGILEARWWSAEEIEATTEPVFPVDLASRLRTLSTAKETGR